MNLSAPFSIGNCDNNKLGMDIFWQAEKEVETRYELLFAGNMDGGYRGWADLPDAIAGDAG